MEQFNIHEFLSGFFAGKEKNIIRKLSERLSEGSVAIDMEEFDKEEQEHLHKLESNTGNEYPIVVSQGKVYLHRYWKYEEEIVEVIKNLSAGKNNLPPEDEIKEKIAILFPDTTANKPDWQKTGVLLGLMRKFLIITGGPGTGKTTTVSKLLALRLMFNYDLKIALAAPTGKAASRLNESMRNNLEHLNIPGKFKEKISGIKAVTIHRLLGAHADGSGFTYNKNHRLPYDLVVVDESSMIDVSLMHKLLTALKPGSSIVLLGDKDQLASVEAGSVFGDLCKSVLTEGKNNVLDKEAVDYLETICNTRFDSYITGTPNILTGRVVQLTESHRFNKDSGIARLAEAVLSGNAKSEWMKKFYSNELEDVKFFETRNEATALLKKWYNNFFPDENTNDNNALLETIGKIKILCAVKNAPSGNGTDYMNLTVENEIKKRLNLTYENQAFYRFRQIMLTRNDYENGVFNGDIGIINIEKGSPKAIFPSEDGNPKIIDPYRLASIQTAFAITIHKSQGSEFDKVIIVLPSSPDSKILSRELLYTAITRAKKELIIISPKEVLNKAIKNRAHRSSGITDRIKNKDF